MNPEFRRNLWLEFGWHRRIVAPAVLLLVLGLFAAGTEAGRDWRVEVHPVALTLAFVILLFWGTRQASLAVVEEMRDRTWDLQRLSALGPWSMTWAKLAGATVFPWYAGAICLAAVAVTAPGVPDRPPTGWLILTMTATAVALHGAALAASLFASRGSASGGSRFGTLFLVAVVFLFLWAVPFASDSGIHRPVAWYSIEYDRVAFLGVSAVAFAFWGVLGAYRGMCRELQVRTLPWAWPAFIVFVAAWLAGWVNIEAFPAVKAFVAIGLLASVFATYFALFGDLTTAATVRHVLAKAGSGQWRRALEELPLWPASLALAALFAIAAPFVFAETGRAVARAGWPYLQNFAVHAPVALVLLAARDCAILAFFAFAPRPRRVAGATLLYVVLLSWVIPGFLGAIGLRDLATLLMPLDSLDGPRAAIIMAVQASIAWGLAAWRWKRRGRPAA